jgi:hypothetical protein
MAVTSGRCRLNAEGSGSLATILLKGGFLWTDDMWGEEQWEVWQSGDGEGALPPGQYPFENITPADPLFSAQVVVSSNAADSEHRPLGTDRRRHVGDGRREHRPALPCVS